jgi:hypothetical protein
MASAAAELGISASALQQRTAKYREHAGIQIQRRVPRTVREDLLKRELATLEKSLQGQMDRYFGIILQKLDDIEAQQKKLVIVKEFTPSHRRVADGGLPVNQQRKAFKRKMAS